MNTQPLTWSVSAASEQGLRSENQDRMTRFSSPFGELILVADGMGGMRGGAKAAATVTEMLPGLMKQFPATMPAPDALRQAVRAINEEIYRLGNSGDPAVAKMGTTIVLALLRDTGETLVANIGDSRAYLFRKGTLQQLTKDHSAVQRLVDAGVLSPEQARTHPESSVLTRAIGQQPDVQLEVYPPFRLEPGDGLLLCSDGLSGFTGPENIAAVLQQNPDPAQIVNGLGRLALDAGSDDNITIQYLRVNGAIAPAIVPPGKTWKRWTPYALAATVVLATGIGVAQWRSSIPTLEIRIANGTGEKAPKQQETPQVTAHPKPAAPEKKAKVVIYIGQERPKWLNHERKLDCVDIRHRKSAELDGKFRDPEAGQTRIIYRPEAEEAKNCLVKNIPELADASQIKMHKLPKDVDIVVVLPEPESADI